MFDLPSSSRGLAALVRHRLFQFGVIGGALFVMAPARSDGHTLTIPAARIDAMVRLEASRQAPPRSEEALRRDVIVRLIEDELLIHEARRLGLDQDDHILRQRLVQKALFLAEDMGGASRAASEADLREFYAAHRAEYAEERLTYTHVFARERPPLSALREKVVAYAAAHPAMEPPFGEPLPVARRADTTARELEREWGAEFAAAVRSLPEGTWSQPLPSRRGYHLVLVERRTAEAPSFEAVRGRVELEETLARRRQAVISFLDNARRHYQVVVEGDSSPPRAWIGRTALRTAPSVED